MGELTLRQALDEYKDVFMASRNFAARTRVEYFNDLEDLIEFLERLGLQEVAEIELPKLQRYLAELDQRGLAGTTRKRKVVSIRSFLSYLYQNQYLPTNIAGKLIPPFAEAKSLRYLTKGEYERLLEAASHNLRDFAIIQLILQTGIKLSELTRLTANDIELPVLDSSGIQEVGFIRILGDRSKKGRKLPLNNKACVSLAAYLKEMKSIPNIGLFTNRFGERLGSRGVEKIVNKYMLQSGIADASVQTLRHTFGIHHVASGTDLNTIRKVMGHRDRRSMLNYISLAHDLTKVELQDHAL